jgi:hypothetical protein
MTEYMRRWGVLFRTPVVWVEVFVAYITAVVLYYVLKVDVPIAVLLGLLLAASVSVGRSLRREQRSRLR